MQSLHRILLRLPDRHRRLIDPLDIYYLEADGDETLVRTRSRHLIRDIRSLGELEPYLEAFPFFRIHEASLVNLHRVREIRPRESGDDWEVVMEPPVNRILAVSRGRRRELEALFVDPISG